MKYHFPFENNTLNGIFGKGILKKTIEIRHKVKISPLLGSYTADKCFDGDFSTFCHTHSDDLKEHHYLEIRFFDAKVRIE